MAGTRLGEIFGEQEFRYLAVQLVAEFGWASAEQIRDACCAAADAVPQFSGRQIFLNHAREWLNALIKQPASVETAAS